MPNIFIVDCMLGKLAVRLRLLGYDTLYYPDADDSFLLRQAKEEGRLLLTRDLALTKVRNANAYFIASKKLNDQILELIDKLKLKVDRFLFFTRCTQCNDLLQPVAKDKVRGKVPPLVYKTYDQFSYSPTCGRYYWKGSHYDRLLAEIKDLIK